jgi:hypothetical protein
MNIDSMLLHQAAAKIEKQWKKKTKTSEGV